MRCLDPQVYLKVLRGTAQYLAGSLTGLSPTGNIFDISQGKMGKIQTLDLQYAASEVRAAVSSRVPSIFVTAMVNASSVSHAARVIPRSARSSLGARKTCTWLPPVHMDSL